MKSISQVTRELLDEEELDESRRREIKRRVKRTARRGLKNLGNWTKEVATGK